MIYYPYLCHHYASRRVLRPDAQREEHRILRIEENPIYNKATLRNLDDFVSVPLLYLYSYNSHRVLRPDTQGEEHRILRIDQRIRAGKRRREAQRSARLACRDTWGVVHV